MYGVSEGPGQGLATSRRCSPRSPPGPVLLAAMVVVELRTAEPMVDLRLLGNRLFRSGNGVMVLASIAFLGTLYAISLYYQDGRGLSALGSGLSTFPEAIGRHGRGAAGQPGAVPAARPAPPHHHRAGRHGGLDRPAGPARDRQTSLWWARLLMFTLGLSMAQVFVPVQAAAFATITPAATGRASTMFNAVRQLGGAIGVAVLTTAIVLIGPVHLVGGHEVANLTAYRVAFLASRPRSACCAVRARCPSTTPTRPARSPAGAARQAESRPAPASAA